MKKQSSNKSIDNYFVDITYKIIPKIFKQYKLMTIIDMENLNKIMTITVMDKVNKNSYIGN